nr:hypothetical protein [uncultured Shinella sp.]
MTWLSLTTENDDRITIDSEKVLQIKAHPKGSHITLTTILPNKDGKLSAKSIVVAETVEEIGKALKAVTVRK